MMQDDLWNNVEKFDINATSNGNGFALKLAREHNWPYNFTKEAIIEYKKFMYLAATCDFMVSPSRIVDEVWHLHLTYSKSYKSFCEILGKNIEHTPSDFSDNDVKKYRLAKEKTKIEYEKKFGSQPIEYWVHFDMFDQLGLPKAKYKFRTKIIFLLLLCIVLYYPFYLITRRFIVSIDSFSFLISSILIFALSLIVLHFYNLKKTSAIVLNLNKNCFVFNLTPLELIYLKSKHLIPVIHAVINNLILEKKLNINSNFKIVKTSKVTQEDVSKEAVLEYISDEGEFYPIILSKVIHRSNYMNIKKSMDSLEKYFEKSKVFSSVLILNISTLSVIIFFNFLRLTNGLVREKPIGFLFLLIVLMIIISTKYIHYLYSMVSKRALTQYYESSLITDTKRKENWAWEYFMFREGMYAIEFKTLVGYVENNNRGSSSSGGSSCGSSCGNSCGSSCGSSCGGGCGGCGGD